MLKKTGGKLEARKTRDALAHRLDHLHSPALPDPGEGEGVGGRARRGDVGGERDSGGPRGHGPVDSFLPSVLRLVQVKKM